MSTPFRVTPATPPRKRPAAPRRATLTALLAASPDGPARASSFPHHEFLARLARNDSIEELLVFLTRTLERQAQGVLASVMLLDEEGIHLRVAAAPSLPPEYTRAIDGVAIGPGVGSCGRAAYCAQRVIVSDIATDPLWRDYRDVAARAGLAACWSEPICAADGTVLGTFAMYFRTVREPEPADLDSIAGLAALTTIAIERDRDRERLGRLTKLNRARSEISKCIVRTGSDAELLAQVCRVAVEQGGVRMAWIAAPEKVTRRLMVLAHHGEGLAYLDGLVVSARADLAEGRGPTGSALRSGESFIVNSFATHSATAPWRARARQFNFQSSGSFPILRNRGVQAVLTVYSDRANAFDADAVALLQEICNDIGLALDNLDGAREHLQVLEDLRRSEKHFRAYFERSMIGMAATGRDRRWIDVNEALCAMLGYTREEMLTRTWADLTHPDDLAASEHGWHQLVDGKSDEIEADKRYLHKDGSIVYTRIAGRAVRSDSATGFDYIVLLVQDVSERHAALQALMEKNQFLDSVLQNEPECVKVVAPDGRLLQMNAAGLKMLGVRNVEDAAAAGLLSFILPQYRRDFMNLHTQVCRGATRVLEFELRGADGVERWVETHATPLRDGAGTITGLLGITRDITDKKRAVELIWKRANIDILTGLPNRYLLQERLSQDLARARESERQLALLYIDLDEFKEVNDTLGHETGDALLVAVARRIAACVRDTDTVARLGGDEFTVTLASIEGPAGAERVARHIVGELGRVFQLGNEAIHLSASVGITYFPEHAQTVDAMLRNADQAMYAAKRQGRNRVGTFSLALQEEAQHRLRMIQDLRGALAAGQFLVHYQPVVDLHTRRICGAEALVRWRHPLRGMVPPGEFITLAEETGLIADIGDWVFRDAATWAKRWAATMGPDFWVSVNHSPVQFRDAPRMLARLDYLREIGLPGRNITLEITEGLLLDGDAAITELFHRLHEGGLRVAVDDFGTGYSSLSYLHTLQIDCLKIDQSFVRNLHAQRGTNAISESIIVMAHKLGLSVVAEGVETQEQYAFLLNAGCDFAQGYLFARPMPPEQFCAMVEAGLAVGGEDPDQDW